MVITFIQFERAATMYYTSKHTAKEPYIVTKHVNLKQAHYTLGNFVFKPFQTKVVALTLLIITITSNISSEKYIQ